MAGRLNVRSVEDANFLFNAVVAFCNKEISDAHDKFLNESHKFSIEELRKLAATENLYLIRLQYYSDKIDQLIWKMKDDETKAFAERQRKLAEQEEAGYKEEEVLIVEQLRDYEDPNP